MSPEPVVRTPLLDATLGSHLTDFQISEWKDTGGDSGLPRGSIPLHRHRSEDEGWYVLEGTLRFRFGDREFDAVAGSGVLLPHGTPHTFWNPDTKPARYLIIVRPRTAALLEAIHAGQPRTGEELLRLYDSFDIDLLD